MRWYKRLAILVVGAVATGAVVGVALMAITYLRGAPELALLFLEVGFVIGFVIGVPATGFVRKLRRKGIKSSGIPEPRSY